MPEKELKSTGSKEKTVNNPKGLITLKAAYNSLPNKLKINPQSFRIAAFRDGFKSEIVGVGRSKLLLDELRFKQWLKDSFVPVPAGYETIIEIAKELNITTAYVYILIQRGQIRTKKYGPGRGKVYALFADVQKVINEKRQGSIK